MIQNIKKVNPVKETVIRDGNETIKTGNKKKIGVAVKEKAIKLGAFLVRNLDDIFYIFCMALVTFATFLLNSIAGFYVLGACFAVLGYIFTLNMRMKSKKQTSSFAAQNAAKKRR